MKNKSIVLTDSMLQKAQGSRPIEHNECAHFFHTVCIFLSHFFVDRLVSLIRPTQWRLVHLHLHSDIWKAYRLHQCLCWPKLEETWLNTIKLRENIILKHSFCFLQVCFSSCCLCPWCCRGQALGWLKTEMLCTQWGARTLSHSLAQMGVILFSQWHLRRLWTERG